MPERAQRRWDIDERGHGVADARAFVPAIDELLQLASTADWVAEEPDAHLLPHLARAAAADGLALDEPRIVDGVFEIGVELPEAASPGAVRAAVYRLLASTAEVATFVRERQAADGATFEVVTGIPPAAGPFATHGHTVRIHARVPRAVDV